MFLSPFRYPDKPTQSHYSVLPTLDEGDWLAQMKWDGWRCWIEYEGLAPGRPAMLKLTSRDRIVLTMTPAMTERVMDALGRIAPCAGWSCLLDAELMGKRSTEQREGLILLDALATSNLGWIGEKPALERFQILNAMKPDPAVLPIVECRRGGYLQMFEDSKKVPHVEGIVVKRIQSGFVGSVRKSIDNPRWLKMRWRGGFDGKQEVR